MSNHINQLKAIGAETNFIANELTQQILDKSTWYDQTHLMVYYLTLSPLVYMFIASITLVQNRKHRTQKFLKLINTTIVGFYIVFLQMLLNKLFDKKHLIMNIEENTIILNKINVNQWVQQINIDSLLTQCLWIIIFILFMRTAMLFFQPTHNSNVKKKLKIAIISK